MPQACTVCINEHRMEIDAALVAGIPNRRVAAQYGLSEASVRRHKAKHLPAKLVRAQQAQEIAEANGLLEQMRNLQTMTLDILNRAYDTNKLGMALGAIKEARGNLELLGKLTGELATQKNINVAMAGVEMPFKALADALVELDMTPQETEIRISRFILDLKDGIPMSAYTDEELMQIRAIQESVATRYRQTGPSFRRGTE